MEIHSHTCMAPERSLFVNANLLVTGNSAALVDAQFLRSEAKKVIDEINQSSVDLKFIFITHGHPDHYLGLETIAAAFPSTPVLAPRGVAEYIRTTGQSYIRSWKPTFGDEIADRVIVPEPFEGDRLELEGHEIRVIGLDPAESIASAALYVPSQKMLLAGDAAFNHVHLWLAEDRPDGWLRNLELLRRLDPGPSLVLPGHGEPVDASVFDEDERYIRDFLDITSHASSREEAFNELTSRFPGYRVPLIARLSIDQRMKEPAIAR